MVRIWVLLLFLSGLVPIPALGSSGISYHGKILKPNGDPVNSSTTQFRIQILSPGSERCVLWDETQTKDLSQTSGVFSITINDVTEPSLIINTLPFTIERVFSNKTGFTGLTCGSGTTYTPSSQIDGRILQAYFREATSGPWEQVPVLRINYVPLALNSVQLQGYQADEFLKIDPYVGQAPLSNAGVNTLLSLVAGTSTAYVKPTDALGGDLSGTFGAGSVVGIRGRAITDTVPLTGQVLKYNGTAWVAAADDSGGSMGDASYAAKGIVQFQTDAATSGISVTAGVARLADTIVAAGPVGDASTVPVITYDSKGRLTTVSTAAVNDTSKLSLAGGTMTGPVNMGLFNITNATSVAANNFSGRNLLLTDSDTNIATLRAPINITTDYTLTLPTAAPTNGYVLSSDGTGQLSWIPAATGSVTSVSATSPVLSSGGATPIISLDTGLGASKIPQVGGTALGANGVVVANGLGTALSSLNCAVDQVIKFDASGFATCGADAATDPNAILNGGNSFTANATIGTNDAYALNFETQGTTKMTVLANGNVGIGTTSPNARLHSVGADGTAGSVNGTSALNVISGHGYSLGNGNGGGIFLTAGNSSGSGVGGGLTFTTGQGTPGPSFTRAGDILIQHGTGYGQSTTQIFGGNYQNQGAPFLSLNGSGSVTTGSIELKTAGNSGLVGATGGITIQTGSVNSSYTGANAGSISILAGNGGGSSSIGGSVNITAGNGGTTGTNNGSSIVLTPGAKNGAGTDGNIIMASTRGKVGIGTTSPSFALDLVSSDETGAVQFTNAINPLGIAQVLTLVGSYSGGGGSTGVGAGITFKGETTSGSSHDLGSLQMVLTDGTHATRSAAMLFNTVNNAGAASERMRISANGNVGIGTTSPGAPLDVKGAIRMSGATSGYTGFQPAAAAGSTVWTLPSADGTNNQVLTTNGSGILSWSTPSGSGVTSLGGQTGATQTFANGATGTAPAFSSATDVHTLNIPLASGAGVTSGTISKTDYDNFNNKIAPTSGTSGGIPYFDSASTLVSSGVLAANGVVLGGGAGVSPSTTAAGTANQVLRVPAGGGAPVFGLLDLTASMTGILPIANGGTNSSTALTNGKVMVSSAGTIIEGNASNTAKSNDTFVMRDGSGNIAAALGTFDQLAVNGSVSGTVNVYAPSTFTNYNLTLPVDDGTPGQVLTTDGAGVTSWATAVTSTTGFIQGGNSFTAAATLGTNDNYDLNFETNGTTKMNILADGKVGIGTTTPAANLHVMRSATATAVFDSAGTSTYTSVYLSKGGVAFGELISYGSNNDFHLNAKNGAGKLQLGSGGSGGRLVIDSTGNVGIGSASPSSKLYVAGGAIGVQPIVGAGSTTNDIFLQAYNSAGAARMSIGYDNLQIGMVINNTSGMPIAYFSDSQKMGIGTGTTIPTSRLEVKGTTSDSTASAVNVIDSSNNSKFLIRNDGNVGIGTTSPARLLHLAGPMRMTPAALPGTPAAGDMAIDSGDANKLKFYNGSAWVEAGGGGGSGTVTSVSSANSDIAVSMASPTPVLTLNSGVGNNQIVKLNGSAELPAVSGVNLTSLNATNLGSGTVPAARMPALTGDVTTSAGAVATTIAANAVTSSKILDDEIIDADIKSNAAVARTKLASGTTNHVLINDGSGVMSSEANLAVSRGGTGAGSFVANKIVGTNGTGSALTSFACTLDQVIKFDVSGNAVCGTDNTGAGSGFVDGGNTFSATATIGTNSNHNLEIETNGSTKMTVLANGNVGVGTTTPTALLHVVQSSASGAMASPLTAVGAASSTAGAAGGSIALTAGAGNGSGTGGAVTLTSGAGNGGTGSVLSLTGATNAGSNLTLTAGNSGGLGGGSVSIAGGNGNGGGTGTGGAVNLTGGTGTNGFNGGNLVLNGGVNGGGAGTDGNVILANLRGKVGIGTASPGSALQIGDKKALHIYIDAGVSTQRFYELGTFDGNNGEFKVSGIFGGHLQNQGRANVDLVFAAREGFTAIGSVLGTVGTSADIRIYLNAGIYRVYVVTNNYSLVNAELAATQGAAVTFNNTYVTSVPSGTLTYTMSTDVGSSIRMSTAGNVGIGTTTPTYALDVKTRAGGTENAIAATNSSGTNIFNLVSYSGYGQMALNDNSGAPRVTMNTYGAANAFLTLNSNNSNRADGADLVGHSLMIYTPAVVGQENGIAFGNGGNNVGAAINFYTTDLTTYGRGGLKFKTSNSGSSTTRMTIDSSGNVGIGTTSPQTTLQVDGTIAPAVDNTNTLGSATYRFTTVYATNGTINTSDRREKKEIDDTDLGLAFINKLRPVSYRWNTGVDNDVHYGLIAQEAQQVIDEVGKREKTSIVTHDKTTDRYGVRYSELISPLIKAIQELYIKILGVDREIASVKAEAKARADKLEAQNAAIQQENAELKIRLDQQEKELAAIKDRLGL